jgi:hypothetical protein
MLTKTLQRVYILIGVTQLLNFVRHFQRGFASCANFVLKNIQKGNGTHEKAS